MSNDVIIISSGCLFVFVILIAVVIMIIVLSGNNNDPEIDIDIIKIEPKKVQPKNVIKIESPKKIIISPLEVEEEIYEDFDIKLDDTVENDIEKINENNNFMINENNNSMIEEELFQIEDYKDYDYSEIKINNSIESDFSVNDTWIEKPFTDNPGYKDENSNFYFINEYSSDDPNIIDVAKYGSKVYFLYNNNVIRVGNKKYSIRLCGTSSLISSIIVYRNYLIGLADGALYYLKDQSGNKWKFKLIDFDNFNEISRISHKIYRMETTLDKEFISIQTEKHLYLFDNKAKLIVMVDYCSSFKRVYGNNHTIYVDIDIRNKIAKLSLSNYRYHNIYDAAIMSNGELVPITLERHREYGFSRIRIIDDIPYFLRY